MSSGEDKAHLKSGRGRTRRNVREKEEKLEKQTNATKYLKNSLFNTA